MTEFKPFYLLILVFLFILFLLVAIANRWFNKALLAVLFSLSLLVFTVLLLIQVMMWFSNYSKADNKNTKGKVKEHFRRINELLISMPNGDPFKWDTIQTRIMVRKFPIMGLMKDYIAIVGPTMHNKNFSTVIYDVEKDDVAEIICDPSPAKLNDPFLDFEPVKIRTVFYPQDDVRKRDDGRVTVNIKDGKPQDESSVVDRAYDAIMESKRIDGE